MAVKNMHYVLELNSWTLIVDCHKIAGLSHLAPREMHFINSLIFIQLFWERSVTAMTFTGHASTYNQARL